ncbi:hypothetical protein HU200_048374 [Digitaria exilis]|uniref:Cyclin-like domain-containing protein n=1 Tax=Digitaria exilis TaxID=1010633 RepID=A0A835B0Z7_9POAL|nr:hypothetical protein HU200_048374 [Digitaria exilis]
MCLEDSADIDGGAGDEELLLLLCGDAEVEDDEEEYMGHLVSKESSFCCSPSSSSSSPAFSDFSEAGDESSSMPSSDDDWFRCARRATVKWILETRACFGFSHRTAYLSVAYFDRFCLHRCFDRSVMPWAARLLAVACVSVAAKMEEYSAPALSEFSTGDDDEYEFSCVSIRRMELLVLSTLEWRMGGVTPFDYLPCLRSMLRRRNNASDGGIVAAKAAALIFASAQAASVLDYRPSTVAVAAVLAAIHGAMTKETLESKMGTLSPSCLLDKEDVYACHSLMLSESESSSAATSKTAKRPPPSSSDSIGAASSYESIDAAATARCSKRAKLVELPAIGR